MVGLIADLRKENIINTLFPYLKIFGLPIYEKERGNIIWPRL